MILKFSLYTHGKNIKTMAGTKRSSDQKGLTFSLVTANKTRRGKRKLKNYSFFSNHHGSSVIKSKMYTGTGRGDSHPSVTCCFSSVTAVHAFYFTG